MAVCFVLTLMLTLGLPSLFASSRFVELRQYLSILYVVPGLYEFLENARSE